MKSKYHIIVDKEDADTINNALNTLRINDVKPDNNTQQDKISYHVHLSKYDLLYIRLSCKAGKVIRVNEETVSEL